jgi:hypothetical protein
VGSDAYKVFEMDMDGIGDQAVMMSLKKSRDFTGWFSFPAFREMCRVTAEELGLPDVHAAYIESCMADQNHTWSHAAVYHAAKQTDRMNFGRERRKRYFPCSPGITKSSVNGFWLVRI